MSRPAADQGNRSRVALVGAEALDGVSLRKALAEYGVPGSCVDLYGSSDDELLLSEYAGGSPDDSAAGRRRNRFS